MKRHFAYTYLYIISFAWLTLLFSCAEIDLCEDHEHAHNPFVQYSFDWGNRKQDAPEQMYAMAYRIINKWKRADVVSGNETSEPVDVSSGEYKFIAVQADHETYDLSDVESCMQLLEEAGRVQDKYVSYTLFNKEQITEFPNDWEDHNSYSQFIQPDVKPFFFDTISIVKIENGINDIKFTPKPITQNIDVIFNIKKDLSIIPFTIDAVYAELGGIPVSFSIANHFIKTEKTAKLLFPMSLTSGGGSAIKDSGQNTFLRCFGNIDVPTVINSRDAKTATGPGILQVILYTTGNDGGVEKKRRMQGKINLYHTIAKANLTRWAEDCVHVVRNGEHAQIIIDVDLEVNAQGIINGKDGEGIDRWLNSDNIIVDL